MVRCDREGFRENVRALELSGGRLKAVFEDGLIKEVQRRTLYGPHDVIEFEQSWGYYAPYEAPKDIDNDDDEYVDDPKSDRDDNPRQNSGAYIFRPATDAVHIFDREDDGFEDCEEIKHSVYYYETKLLSEVHREVSPWVRHVTRVVRDVDHLESEYMVGPIYGAAEVVTDYRVRNLRNKGVFRTDSNGRDLVERRLDHRPTWAYDKHQAVAGNYYPVTAAIQIKDDDRSAALSVLTDRAQGGTSLTEGAVQLMVHRQTREDDHKGVGEPMADTVGGREPYPPYGNARPIGQGVRVVGTHKILFSEDVRAEADRSFSPLHLFFGTSTRTERAGDEEWDVDSSNVDELSPFRRGRFTSLAGTEELPSNLMLVTLLRLRDLDGDGDDKNATVATTTTHRERFLVRVAHQYGVGEGDAGKDSPTLVMVRTLFPDHHLLGMVEKTLSNARTRADAVARRIKWTARDGESKTKNNDDDNEGCVGDADEKDDEFTFTVRPMRICTFEVTARRKSAANATSASKVKIM